MAVSESIVLDAQKSRAQVGGPSFGLRNRIFRAIWNLVWIALASWTYPLHGWRRMLLRLFGANIGKGVFVSPSAKIWYPPFLDLCDFVAIGDSVDLYCMAPIKIGRYAIVSKGAHLCGGSHDIDDKYFQLITGRIEIGDYAWIAAEAFVGPNVKVGEGAVLGARAVAFRDLEPWSVYAGNPATKKRGRAQFERIDCPLRSWQR